MKAPIRELIILPGIGLMVLTGVAAAQTFSTLHTFTGYADQGNPDAELILSGKTLYGTASGGFGASGAVFAMNTDGKDFTSLYTFADADGSNPQAGLILSGDILYGTTWYGGSNGDGTVFAVNIDGTGFTNLHHFTGDDGALPLARLLLSGNTLYGTAENGGSYGKGTVFGLNIDGSGFVNLHSFSAAPGPSFTNGDGTNPRAGLVLSGNSLYGTAPSGGGFLFGTAFTLSFTPQLTIMPSGPNVILSWPTI